VEHSKAAAVASEAAKPPMPASGVELEPNETVPASGVELEANETATFAFYAPRKKKKSRSKDGPKLRARRAKKAAIAAGEKVVFCGRALQIWPFKRSACQQRQMSRVQSAGFRACQSLSVRQASRPAARQAPQEKSHKPHYAG
jgi:hypothetical protein